MMTARIVNGQTCYVFEGRLRDNINRGGEKIGCEEVEAQVGAHPAIAEARLVAMPDPFYGEKGCLFVILRPGHAAPTVPELAAFLTGRGLAKYKCPGAYREHRGFPRHQGRQAGQGRLAPGRGDHAEPGGRAGQEQDDDQH